MCKTMAHHILHLGYLIIIIISSRITPIPRSCLLTIVRGDNRLLSKIPDLDSTGKEYTLMVSIILKLRKVTFTF
jgi:hypothetical protein